MQHSNFEFVRHYHPELFSQLQQAEQLLGGDASCFLLKLRLSLELWSHDFADLRGIKLDLELCLADKLQLLSTHVNFPESYLSQLTALRQLCNQGLHLKRDSRARHVIQQQLSRSQQLNALNCLFNLVLFNVRYTNPDSELPSYLPYPQFNLQQVLNAAFAGDGDACCQLALLELERHGDGVDARYWFDKAVAAGSPFALQTVLNWQQGQQPALALRCHELKQLLQRYIAAKPTARQSYQLARLAEALQCHDKALPLYLRAAMAGDARAITELLHQHKRLTASEYQRLLDIGVKCKHPLALQQQLLLWLDDDAASAHAASCGGTVAASGEGTVPAWNDATAAKAQRLLALAKACSVPALPYLQALWQVRTGDEFTPSDWAQLADLFAAGARHIAAHLRPDVQVFDAAMNAELWPLAGQFAKRALAQQQHYASAAELAQTQLDIARLLLRLADQHTPLPFEFTPRQLVQKAAQAGNAEAMALQVRIKTSALTPQQARGAQVRGVQVRGVQARGAGVKVPSLLQQMLRKRHGTALPQQHAEAFACKPC